MRHFRGVGEPQHGDSRGLWEVGEWRPVDLAEIERLLEKDAQSEVSTLLPIYKERGVYNFYLKSGKRGGVKALSSTEPSDLSKLSRDQLVTMLGELRLSTSSASGSRQHRA